MGCGRATSWSTSFYGCLHTARTCLCPAISKLSVPLMEHPKAGSISKSGRGTYWTPEAVRTTIAGLLSSWCRAFADTPGLMGTVPSTISALTMLTVLYVRRPAFGSQRVFVPDPTRYSTALSDELSMRTCMCTHALA